MSAFRLAYLAGFVLVGFSGGSPLAWAGDPPKGTLNQSVSTSGGVVPSGARASVPKGPQTEATCGMACRYHRANDNLTLQALYLVTKIQKVEAELQRDSESMAARTALGGFCKTSSEDLGDCFSRYKVFQRVALLDIRQAIGKNEDMIAQLTLGRKSDGSVEGTALTFNSGEDATYFPDIPTLAELEAAYLKGKLKPAGSKYSRSEIQKWSQELVINNPKEKYFQFTPKPVVGNPYQDEKTSYSLYMKNPATGEDKKAVQLYRDSEKTVKEFAKDEKKEIADNETKVITPTKKLKDDDAVSYQAFTQARSVVNGKIDNDVKRGEEEQAGRKLASQPKPSPVPSGSPVPTVMNSETSREVKVTTGTSAIRAPSGYKTYGDDEKVERPPEMKNSRYIKYDLGDMLNDIDTSTK